ncbi:asialoglycoprotein receptor 1-like [Hemicordylus capensis]|uniref:asialoglycoprotein receptor 1-like n=1 Tax=Hemicordylus capensis TaxID=884348 RepID=UPI00230403B0|nr:asialoglycoprotein receptor 1-like [Hemicordylus capensis]
MDRDGRLLPPGIRQFPTCVKTVNLLTDVGSAGICVAQLRIQSHQRTSEDRLQVGEWQALWSSALEAQPPTEPRGDEEASSKPWDVVDQDTGGFRRAAAAGLPSPQSPRRRICPTSRLLLVLTVFCGLLSLSVVILGVKRAHLGTGQQGAREALQSFNVTFSKGLLGGQHKENSTRSKLKVLETMLSSLGNKMEKVKTRLKNHLDSLQRDSRIFHCDLVELKSNGSKTGCCPKNWAIFHQSCYWTTRMRLPWEEAKLDCEKKSAHLVIINSPDEKAFVNQHKRSDIWIGLTDSSGSWKWVDGSSYSLRQEDWGEGQPDHWYGHGLGGGEDCVQMFASGQWNDNHCSRPLPWMCELELNA